MSLFSQFYKSLYSPNDMARFRFQKIGKTIVYILLLAFLTTVPETTQMGQFLKQQIFSLQEHFQKDVPNFSIENGELKADSPNRIEKFDNDFTFVFDPNGIEQSISPSVLSGIYFLKDRFVTITNGERQVFTYASVSTFPISKIEVLQFFDFINSPIAILLIGTFLFFINAFTSFIGVTILAGIGLLLSKQMKRRLSYKQLWTLTSYCITIPTIFFVIMKYLHISVFMPLYVHTFVTLVLLYITLKEVPPFKRKN